MTKSVNSLIKYGSSFVFIKYLIVAIGFIRSILIASILSVYDMGILAFIYLLFEYTAYVLPFGSINSVNKQISNLRAEEEKLNINDNPSLLIYNSGLIIISQVLILAAIFIFIIDTYLFNFIPIEIVKSKVLFFSIIAMSIYRAFANMHNRLWQKYVRLFFSESAYAIVYLLGIYFFLNSESDYTIILEVLLVSLIISVIISGYIPNIRKLRFINLNSIKVTFSIGFFLMCYITMEQLFWGIDRFFIASILDPEQLAVFHISHTFARGVLMFYVAITFLFYPILLTFFTSKNIETNKFSETLVRMSRFSESIMILALIAAMIIIPHFVSFFLPQYPDIRTLFFIVLLGLTLKCLSFFPSSYFIAQSWQKNLTLISLIFIIFVGSTYYLAGKVFELHAFGYTAIAVIIFFLFLCTLMLILQNKIQNKNKFIFLVRIYYKIFLTIVLSLFLLSFPNYLTVLSNLNILLLSILLLYLNDFFMILNTTYKAFLYKDGNKILNTIIKIDP